MDTAKFDLLEQHIQHLLAVLAHVKEENARLSQSLTTFHNVGRTEQHSSADWDAVQAELLDLRSVAQTLRQERVFIRAKLEAMLGAVERLEEKSSAVARS